MKKQNNLCQYKDPEGYVCEEAANNSRYCYWHDHSIDKTGNDVKQALVDFAG
jgi:hypothetical protein